MQLYGAVPQNSDETQPFASARKSTQIPTYLPLTVVAIVVLIFLGTLHQPVEPQLSVSTAAADAATSATSNRPRPAPTKEPEPEAAPFDWSQYAKPYNFSSWTAGAGAGAGGSGGGGFSAGAGADWQKYAKAGESFSAGAGAGAGAGGAGGAGAGAGVDWTKFLQQPGQNAAKADNPMTQTAKVYLDKFADHMNNESSAVSPAEISKAAGDVMSGFMGSFSQAASQSKDQSTTPAAFQKYMSQFSNWTSYSGSVAVASSVAAAVENVTHHRNISEIAGDFVNWVGENFNYTADTVKEASGAMVHYANKWLQHYNLTESGTDKTDSESVDLACKFVSCPPDRKYCKAGVCQSTPDTPTAELACKFVNCPPTMTCQNGICV